VIELIVKTKHFSVCMCVRERILNLIFEVWKKNGSTLRTNKETSQETNEKIVILKKIKKIRCNDKIQILITRSGYITFLLKPCT